MKILFQGGYNTKRDREENEDLVREYVEALAGKVLQYNQHLVMTWGRDEDALLARLIAEKLNFDHRAIKRHLTFYLSDKNEASPEYGVVRRYQAPPYWTGERTLAVAFSDAVLVIGGARGAADAMEKAFLSRKPVFVAYRIKGFPAEVWNNYADDYYYLEPGDADFMTDENIRPEEFFDQVFGIIVKMENARRPDGLPVQEGITLPEIERLRELVAQGKTDEAIAAALKSARFMDPGLYNEILFLSSWLNTIRKDENLGLSDRSEEERRITLTFLKILTDMEGVVKE